MPHYLRMLTYGSQPDDEWGPARKQDQYGRYAKNNVETMQTNYTFEPDICSRL